MPEAVERCGTAWPAASPPGTGLWAGRLHSDWSGDRHRVPRRSQIDPLPPFDVARSCRTTGPRRYSLSVQGAAVRGHRDSATSGPSRRARKSGRGMALKDRFSATKSGTLFDPTRPIPACNDRQLYGSLWCRRRVIASRCGAGLAQVTGQRGHDVVTLASWHHWHRG